MTWILTILLVLVCVASNQLGKRYRSKRAAQSSAAAGSGWWDNRGRTPLSASEAQAVADEAAQFYAAWLSDPAMDHSWLCIAIDSDKIICKALYRDFNEKTPAAPSFSYPHPLSCQADREALAEHILRRIRQDHPTCRLYLDGDALILPTN